MLLSAAATDGVLQPDPVDAAVRVAMRAKAPSPLLASAVAVDASTVRVKFNRVVSRRDAEGLVFKIDGLTIRAVKFPVGRSALLKTSPQQAGPLTLTASSDGSAGPVTSLGAVTFLSATTPRPTSAVALDGSTVRVQFNRVVSHRDAERLVFKIDGLAIRSVTFPVGQRALLKTAPQDAGPLTLTVMTDGTTGPVTSLGTVTFNAKPAPKVVSVVAVEEDRIRVTYDRPMRESAVNASNYSINNDDGATLAVHSATFAGSSNVVDLVTAPQAYGSYSITVNNITDTDGQQVLFDGRSFSGNPKGAVVSAGATSSTNVVVVFNEPMADNALAPQHYVIRNPSGQVLPVTGVRFDGPLGMVVNLTTAPQANVLYQVTVANITDLGGDGMDFRTASFQGVAAPGLREAISTDPKTVVLTFNGAVGDSALTPSVYKIDRLDAAGNVIGSLPITSAAFVGDQRTVVEVRTSTQNDGRYRIATTSALTNAAGSALPAVQVEFQGISGMPKLVSAAPFAPNTVLLTFSLPMSDDALAPSSYVIRDSGGAPLPVLSTQFAGNERRVVRLNTGPQGSGIYTIQSISATDVDGNTVAAPGAAGTFQGSPSPTLSGATPADPTHLTLTFAGPVGDSALSPSSYRIEQLDALGNVVGGLAVNGAAFLGGQRTVVSLTTPTQDAERYRIITTSSLTDAAGLALPVGQMEFQGISGKPVLVGVTSTGPTTLFLTFSVAMSDDALTPSGYAIRNATGGTLPVLSARFIGTERRIVELTTSPQTNQTYTVESIAATGSDGGATTVPTSPTIRSFPGLGTPGESTPVEGAPRVVGAASISNGAVIVSFSEPMAINALRPEYYFIVQQNVNPETGYLQITGAEWYDSTHSVVKLTTYPQNELTYAVTAVAVTDVAGNALAAPILGTGGIVIDPRTAQFPGTPPQFGAEAPGTTDFQTAMSVTFNTDPGYSTGTPVQVTETGGGLTAGVNYFVRNLGGGSYSFYDTAASASAQNAVTTGRIDLTGNITGGIFSPTSTGRDIDSDGLPDNVEMRGWQVKVEFVDGTSTTRTVTSNPAIFDTDGDGLGDYQEANIRTDPRSRDTDDDQLNDFAEFNEIYSNALAQDSDGDSLDDFLEFGFFKTSPYLADTDGDQLRDDYEIFANRNPRVSDLPRPEITVGQVNLQLNVQFTETNDQQRRDLETKEVKSTLTRSARQTFTRSDTVTMEARLDAGTKDGVEGSGFGNDIYLRGGATVGYSFNQSSESATETEQAYESSLSTDREVTRGFTVQRVVQGAVMQVAVDLRNLSSLAYRVKNLQVTAFVQDPQDHGKLTPVATLLPDSEPEDGFTLGSLSPEKGPFIFSNDSIVPRLVESLMANSSGLVFRISNYDIVDENGRNFAFSSQEIVERTARLVVDYGGASSLRALLGGDAFDELKPGDETEIFRVATSAGQVIDTNFDGTIDDFDRRAVFDSSGKEVGVTLFEALAAVGLTRYDEAATPTSSLSESEILGSYSTYVAPAEVIGGVSYPAREKIYRIRGISNDEVNKKYWEILTPLGIDQAIDVNNMVLKSDAPASLNFVQDLDKDALSADVEFFLRTSDSPLPFGAEVPGLTDFRTDMSVTFGTDPGFFTGAIVRVTETGGGLTAGANYVVRNLGGGSYSFYDTPAHAAAGGPTGRVPLTGKITAGVFAAARPIATDTSTGVMSVSFAARPTATDFATEESVTFGTDPGFATGATVQVTRTGGGLTAGTNYFVRKLAGSSYAFYDSAANAAATSSTSGRINLSGGIAAGVLRTADRTFPTGTIVQVTADGGGLTAGTDYFIRNLGEGAYSFYLSALDATAGSAVKTGLVTLTGNVSAGVFSPTAKGRDTDADGLDDRFEALIGWTVTTPQRTYQAYSSPNRADSNFDTPKPGVDSDGDGIEDRIEYSGTDLFAAPAGWEDRRLDTNRDGVIDEFDAPANGRRDRFETFQLTTQSGGPDYVLDPGRKDTDIDGINDATEIIGFKITPITGGNSFWVTTNPTNPFTDSDTFSDGLERILGLDPTNGADTDEDGDGLPDLVETLGWTVFTFGKSTTPYVQGVYAPLYDRHVTPTSTDIFTDAVRFTLANDPNVPRFTLVQATGGGLAANSPYFLGRLVAQPDPNSVRYGLYLSANDAAAGTSKGLFNLTSAVTDIHLAREFNTVAPGSTDLAADAVTFPAAGDPNVSPFTLVQVTGGGLTAGANYFLGRLVAQPDPNSVRYGVYLSANDAAAGTAGGSVNLTSPVTAIRLPAESRKTSQTDSDDSDGDGLSDYDEFFIGTDPSSADSDDDGIEDRVEFLGFTLGHNVGGDDIGIIKTNPLDADTDNDKRSDGAEAELQDVELARWVVRVADETPYQVFSNPLVADADFDSLVDGDEYAAGTDPHKGNTDGDKRSDDIEVRSGTNALAADVQVTVVATMFNNSSSKFTYELSLRTPDTTGQGMAGLSPTLTRIVSGDTRTGVGVGKVVVNMGAAGFVGRVYYSYINSAGNTVFTDTEGDILAHQSRTYNPGLKGVPVGARFRVYMAAVAGNDTSGSQEFIFTGTDTEASFNSGGTTLNHYMDYLGVTGDFALGQAKSFGLATGQHFSIEGLFTNTVTSQSVQLGGLLGIATKQVDPVSGASKDVRSIFAYDDVVTKFIEDYSFTFTMADGSVATLKFFFIVG